jgi:uncharacterized membrane protein
METPQRNIKRAALLVSSKILREAAAKRDLDETKYEEITDEIRDLAAYLGKLAGEI